MTISHQHFEELERKYGRYSSWAIWDPADPRSSDIVRKNIDQLNPKIVMVSLNVSATIYEPWSNFRIGKNDRKLIHAFNQGEYRGAYMTDILKDEVEVDSSNIRKKIKSGELDINHHVDAFKTEMKDVGASKDSLFILFGKIVEETFKKYLADSFPKYIACEHFAVYGSSEDWAEKALSKLRQIG